MPRPDPPVASDTPDKATSWRVTNMRVDGGLGQTPPTVTLSVASVDPLVCSLIRRSAREHGIELERIE